MRENVKISQQVKNDYEKLIEEISEINGIIYHHRSITEIYSKEVKNLNKGRSAKFLLASLFNYRSPYNGKLKKDSETF